MLIFSMDTVQNGCNTCVVLAILLLIGIAAEKSKHDANSESLYPGYKLIKDAIERDPKLVYKLKQTFNPPVNLFNIHLKCMCFISLFLNPHK